MEIDDGLEILIAYNRPSGTDAVELVSEADVVDEADAVREALAELGCKPKLLPVLSPVDALASVRSLKPDLLFNLCEGLDGDASKEKNMAALWELAGIPFTGNGSLALGLAQDKPLAKDVMESRGIRTPRGVFLKEMPDSVPLRFPVIAKPACEDASLGIFSNAVVSDAEALRELLDGLLKKYPAGVLVEEYVDGREFNVAVLNGRALPVSEIEFSALDADAPKITSYEAKWLEDDPLYRKTPAVCPAKIDAKLAAKLQDVALAVFKALRGKDYGRVDMRMDDEGGIFVLEYNPNPCISPDAGFVKALKAAGLSYKDFVAELIEANLGEVAKARKEAIA